MKQKQKELKIMFSMDQFLKETIFFYISKYIKSYIPSLLNVKRICISIEKEKRELAENRLLGLLFLYSKLSTDKIVTYYNQWFGELSRSTLSYYLNGLVKERILNKERMGKEIIFSLNKITYVDTSNPFWFTRNICPTPLYFHRIAHLEKKIITNTPEKELEYILNIINLNLLINRFEKCLFCKYSNREKIQTLINEARDVLNKRTSIISIRLKDFMENFGELQIFGGTPLDYTIRGEKFPKEILEIVKDYKKEIDLQLELNKRIYELSFKRK
ncbi:MAG: hypothetical protein ACTSYZ_04310 [Candidatus Helarchaeota archaeon]